MLLLWQGSIMSANSQHVNKHINQSRPTINHYDLLINWLSCCMSLQSIVSQIHWLLINLPGERWHAADGHCFLWVSGGWQQWLQCLVHPPARHQPTQWLFPQHCPCQPWTQTWYHSAHVVNSCQSIKCKIKNINDLNWLVY